MKLRSVILTDTGQVGIPQLGGDVEAEVGVVLDDGVAQLEALAPA